jgi:DNA-binding ferritin-like protein (Dps family)
MDEEHLIKIKLNVIDEKFKKLNTKIMRKNLTNDPIKRKQYKKETVNTYNSFVDLASNKFDTASVNLQLLLRTHFIKYRDFVSSYLGALKIQFSVPQNLKQKIVLDQIGVSPIPSSESETEIDDPHNTESDDLQNNAKMVMSDLDFINLCAKQISKNYDGNYTSLQAFVNSVKFLDRLATTSELKELLKSFILTKLDQRALEKIPADPASIDVIINGLTQKIKPDSSKVIEGRMVALTADNKNIREFQKNAEKLAEEYQRALVIEGLPLSLAEEKTIDKTVELCRKNSKSSEVRAILSATAHTSAAAVIAKMVVQSDLVKQDRLLQNAEKYEKMNKEKKQNGQKKKYVPNNGANGGQNASGSQSGTRTENGNGNNGQRFGQNGQNGQNGRFNNNGNNNNNGGRNGNNNGNRQFYANGNNNGAVFTVQGNGNAPLPNQGAPQNQSHHSTQYQHM